jgi:hypothetical protein
MASNKEEMEQMCYDPKCKGCPEYKGGKNKEIKNNDSKGININTK